MGLWFDRLLLTVGAVSVIAVVLGAVRGGGRDAPRHPPWRTWQRWQLAVPLLMLIDATSDNRSPAQRWGRVLVAAAFALEFVVAWAGWWRRGRLPAPPAPRDDPAPGEADPGRREADPGRREADPAGAWVCMPDVGDRVGEAVVSSWLRQEGDAVVAGEPLFEISTDKVDTEIPSPGDGVLARIVVPAGAAVVVGTRLALISAAGAEDPPPAAEIDERALGRRPGRPAIAAPTPGGEPDGGLGR